MSSNSERSSRYLNDVDVRRGLRAAIALRPENDLRLWIMRRADEEGVPMSIFVEAIVARFRVAEERAGRPSWVPRSTADGTAAR